MFLKKMEDAEFLQVWEIMQDSFPPDERRPFDKQKALLTNPVYNIYVLCAEEVVLGFIALWKLENLAFLEHFAVAKEHRCKGLGSKLLNAVVSELDTPACLEVEPPCDDITKRRVEFYKRNGFFLNEYPYIQPPLSEDQQAVPLMIMSSDSTLTKYEFDKTRDILYKEVYGFNGIDFSDLL